jgi:hypothetical protein
VWEGKLRKEGLGGKVWEGGVARRVKGKGS